MQPVKIMLSKPLLIVTHSHITYTYTTLRARFDIKHSSEAKTVPSAKADF
jgi:hypothetical protein